MTSQQVRPSNDNRRLLHGVIQHGAEKKDPGDWRNIVEIDVIFSLSLSLSLSLSVITNVGSSCFMAAERLPNELVRLMECRQAAPSSRLNVKAKHNKHLTGNGVLTRTAHPLGILRKVPRSCRLERRGVKRHWLRERNIFIVLLG